MTPEEFEQITAWAKRLRVESESAEARAAARAIIALAGEIERLRTGSGPDGKPPSRGDSVPVTDAQPSETSSPDVDLIKEARRVRLEADRSRRRRARVRLAIVPVGAAALALGTYAMAARLAAPHVEAHGPQSDLIGAAQLPELAFWARAGADTLDRLRWHVDGADATGQTTKAGDRLVLDGRRLGDGRHTVSVDAPGPFPGAGTRRSWTFTVDTRPPAVHIPTAGVTKGSPVRVSGIAERDATVAVDGRDLALDDGRFTISYDQVPTRALQLVAKDRAGNMARKSFRLTLVPRRPPIPLRAVHVTPFAWASPTLRRGVLELVATKRINAVELDLKDESGLVGFDANVPLGRRMGAVRNVYDLEAAVEMLHRRGVWVIGRLVAFRDPIHAAAAWRAGRRNEVVQSSSGGPYSGYGGFTNFSNPAVRRYNIDVALAAAQAGVDDILYDYVRRPDGPLGTMVFPDLRGTPEAAIVTFLSETASALRPYDAFLGASVFGVAATRPLEVAQDIPRMAREVDYIAPMVYPSHWARGEYDVSYPNGQPYEIVRRSLHDFKRQTRGTGARVVPWLQDFSLGVTYGPAEVRAEIRAAQDEGIPEFILWDPLVTYTADALDRSAPRAKVETPDQAAAAAPQPSPPPTPQPGPKQTRAAGLRANELGDVPVLMYHQIRADGGGDYDLTPDEFRRELQALYRDGYRPVRAIDLVTGRLDVPAGKSPVVLTFDDSTKEQLAYDERGRVKPGTAVGIMLAFAETHPDFKPAGTFFVNREPFGGVAQRDEMLRFLVRRGFELGNHTDDHIPFNQKDAEGVRSALVRGKRVITRVLPDAPVRTMALPLGVIPRPASLAVQGRWDGESYQHDGIFLIGAEPAPSPWSRAWRPRAIPRIRTSAEPPSSVDFGSTYWLDLLRRNPGRRYVSDGDPKRLSFPRRLAPQLRPRFRARANPY
jgi:peptidoglycan/xylan/chitin deacetylase (PgdA/CDA1 family)